MIKQRCLIIDEESQDALMLECETQAKQHGVNVEFLYFNPKKRSFFYLKK